MPGIAKCLGAPYTWERHMPGSAERLLGMEPQAPTSDCITGTHARGYQECMTGMKLQR